MPAVPLQGDDVAVLQLQLAVIRHAQHLDVEGLGRLQVLCEVYATVAYVLWCKWNKYYT